MPASAFFIFGGGTFAARWFLVAAIVSLSVGQGLAQELVSAEHAQFFRERIEPVLERHCYECHSASAKKLKGGLRLDTADGLRAGGESGVVIKPGDAANSLLIQALRHEGDLSMPPKQPPLGPEIIADFVRWIELKAPDPRAPLRDSGGSPGNDDGRGFWFYRPLVRAPLPTVHNSQWSLTAIDQCVLSKLEAMGLKPATNAARGDIVRRLSFNLTGLPPGVAVVRDFLQDPAPDAYDRLVDRFLDSPHFGERFGQVWLDVVRYAETEGFEYDRHLPEAWRFRDYVVDSFNRDKPFDRFIAEQIAGDELAPDNPEFQTAAIFHRLGPVRRNAGNPDIALSRNEVLTERTDIIGSAVLGLTVGCARCHNHKFDAISQKDYYRLEAYLAGTTEHDILRVPPEQKKLWEQQTQSVNAELKKLRKRAEDAADAEARRKLNREIEETEAKLPAYPATIPSVSHDPAQRTPIHVLKRGEWEKKGEAVGPRPLSVLVPAETPELPADHLTPRTELARWLTDGARALTARVIVNRVWQYHFGTGLVKTANDFGRNGARPSHPELLDWLAAKLIDDGWRLKPLHRLILRSRVYQQSCSVPEAEKNVAQGVDPENRWLWRFNRRRLSAEEVRDAMLWVSGGLNLKLSGPSVMVPVDDELVNLLYKPSQWQVARQPGDQERRSIYLIAKRNLRLPFMEVFDQPALLTSCARRESSTHAPQALELLNGKLANGLAAQFGARLAKESRGDPVQIVERAFWLALGRAPRREERLTATAFLRDQPVKEFALGLFNLNAFLYVQ
jgi:hypothetical protein